MDCPEPIKTVKAKDLKTKKSKKFNTKSEDGKTYEIEMGLTDESIIFQSEIKMESFLKNFQVFIHLIN